MDIRQKQRVVVAALEDVKGRDIVVFNTARLPSMFERVIIASGDSSRQVKALADHVRDKVKAEGGRVYGVEGGKGGDWVLVDLGEIVVHVMHPTVREFYNLEEVWGGKEVKMKAAAPVKSVPAKKAGRKKPARAKAARRRRRR
jgi:ribosome-associated protein